MLERLTNTLLWDKQLTPRLQRAWAVIILLAPLALAAAFWLHLRIQGRVPARIAIDRVEAISIARRFLDQRGADLNGLRATVDADEDMNMYRYLARNGQAGERFLRGPGAWVRIQVQFEDDDGQRTTRVTLDPTGRITGYRLYFPEDHDFGPASPEAEAAGHASATIDGLLAAYPGLRKGKCELTSRNDSGGASQRYSCAVEAAGLEALSISAWLEMRGNQITGQSLGIELSEEAARAVSVSKFGRNLFVFYALVVLGFMQVRYFKRRAQKEVSRQRMLVVTAIIGGFILAQVLLEDEPIQINNAEIGIPYWLPVLLFGFIAYLAGQCAGLAYAAAEGDLRETRPKALTSLDALLSGKILSRNVGRSVVLGTVLLAWTLLLRNGIYVLANPEFSGIEGIESSYSYLFSRLPWLSLLVAAMSAAVLQSLSALLCPLAILERRFRRRRLIFGLLTLCSYLAVSTLSHDPVEFPAGFLIHAVRTGAVLVSFFGVDLLASIVLATGFPLVVEYTGLNQLSPVWQDHGLWALLVAGLWIAGQTACAFLGRVAEPAQVRPAYASEIHERQQLESEVAAAREAQQRLLPAVPPVLPGLSVAAACSAAEAVNGDFYDYFPISNTKLGVLIIDGGGMGLATALTIALAKGFLMHKAQGAGSPVETLVALRTALGQELEGSTGEGICYIVADTKEGALRYARFGDTPSIFIAGAAHQPQEIRHNVSGSILWEGYAALAPEDRVIAYTNGLSRLLGEPDRRGTDRWLLKRIGGLIWQPPAGLLDSILRQARRGRLGRRQVTDDVTVMVFSFDVAAADSQERVA